MSTFELGARVAVAMAFVLQSSSCIGLDGGVTAPHVSASSSEALDTVTPSDASLTPAPSNGTLEPREHLADSHLTIGALAPGEYLVTSEWIQSHDLSHPDIELLRLTDRDGSLVGNLALGVSNASLARNGTVIAYPSIGSQVEQFNTIKLHDLATGSDRDLGLELEGLSPPSWSPTGEYLVVQDGQDLRVVDLNTGGSNLLLDCLAWSLEVDTGIYCTPAGWSPSGDWLAYRLEVDPPVANTAMDGIYLLDASCVQPSDACASRGHRVLPPSVVAWSPDRDLLAGATPDGDVLIFDSGVSKIVQSLKLDRKADAISWAPSGGLLGYSAQGEIGVLPLDGAEVAPLRQIPAGENGYLSFWLSIPPTSAPPTTNRVPVSPK